MIFLEYAVDVAEACHEQGIKTVAVTAAYISKEPREKFFRHMDAVNVDLKAFTDRFYWKVCGGRLEPVLETLKYLKHETDAWFELTTLLIPGENDSETEIEEMTQWIMEHLGPVCAITFLGLPSRLENAGQIEHAAASTHPVKRYRAQKRTPLRLHRQRPRRQRRQHLLSQLWRDPDRPRLVRVVELEYQSRESTGQLQQLWHTHRWSLRRRARTVGSKAAADTHRGVNAALQIDY